MHFIGHGGFKDDQGVLVFENKAKRSHIVSSERLKNTLGNHESLRLVFLNACKGAHAEGDPFAGVAQSLVKTGIPAVVAMQFNVTDSAAIQLAKSFYSAVALGKPVDSALTTARRMVEAEEEYNFEWGTPVLFMRSPDGYLFDPKLKVRGPVPKCPYKGLAAFKKEDKDDFFGRQRFTKDLLEVVEKKPLVALVGNSGSGKSSVVFAGLVPEIEDKNWLVTSFKPRTDPFYQLATSVVHYLDDGFTELEALKQIEKCAKDLKDGELRLFRIIERIITKHNKPVLLIVDQFEELFTLNPDRDLQHVFLTQLLEVSEKDLQHRLLLTMRSDFMSYALDHTEFGQALSQATVMLTAMSREELREVIQKPAENKGVDLESGLTDTILDDVLTTTDQKDIAGRLPLLGRVDTKSAKSKILLEGILA